MKIKTIPKSKHKISENQISNNALKVLKRLHEVGFAAYLVGGCVRDLLLGHKPKDFDIVTDARPQEIKKTFRNCRLIGRRFRLAHIYFGREIIEVATFRAGDENTAMRTPDGMIMRDNVYGTIEEDAERRDFTVNALFYDIFQHKVLDFVDGFTDLQKHKLDVIGKPNLRYCEDPVRMLRAIRIAGKLNFKITPRTSQPIKKQKRLLKNVSSARLFDEVVKAFHCGEARRVYDLLTEFGLAEIFFPFKMQKTFVKHLLTNTDARIKQHKTIATSFLFAGLLWHAVAMRFKKITKQELPQSIAFDKAMREVLHDQRKHLAIPRRISLVMRDIWRLQRRLEALKPRTIWDIFSHGRFRAAYDLLLLRSKTEKSLRVAVDWWEQFQFVDRGKRNEMIIALGFQKK